jgi:hypothetical protein
LKNKLTAKQVCMVSQTEYFTDFAEKIYSLEFDEQPNYNLLKFYLTKNLLEQDEYPNNDFDWIQKLNHGKFK